jgi:hypothetical protein
MTLAALALAAWLLPLTSARAASADPNTVSIEIQNPQPNGAGVAQGPINANIYAQGQVPAGDSVSVGFAPQSVGCQTGMQQFPSASLMLANSGQFTVQVVWPSDENTLGAQFYLCAQDTTTHNIGQSTTQFQVANSNEPTISVQAVGAPDAADTPTAGAGTPTVAPTATAQDGQGYLGGYLQIAGQNFSPGGTNLLFFLAPQGPFNANEYSPDNALKVVSGTALSDNTSGSFQVVVQLPKGVSGNLAIFATSRDGSQGQVLPSMVANADIILTAPPATPTPGPTATSSVTATPSNGSGGQNSSVSAGQMSVLIGLGALSVIFFIMGIAFLVSAASMPKV